MRIKKGRTTDCSGYQAETTCVYEYGICIDALDVTHYEIGRGEYLATILANLGFEANEREKDHRSGIFHLSSFKITGRKFVCRDHRFYVGREICCF